MSGKCLRGNRFCDSSKGPHSGSCSGDFPALLCPVGSLLHIWLYFVSGVVRGPRARTPFSRTWRWQIGHCEEAPLTGGQREECEDRTRGRRGRGSTRSPGEAGAPPAPLPLTPFHEAVIKSLSSFSQAQAPSSPPPRAHTHTCTHMYTHAHVHSPARLRAGLPSRSEHGPGMGDTGRLCEIRMETPDPSPSASQPQGAVCASWGLG